MSPGSRNTTITAKSHSKPYIENPSTEELVTFIRDHDVHILNVAGNRGSKLTKEQVQIYREVLVGAFLTVLSSSQ